jgi:tetratricopeptide (TPR) repeat protein
MSDLGNVSDTYSIQDVTRLTGLPAASVRACAREVERTAEGAGVERFSFVDLVRFRGLARRSGARVARAGQLSFNFEETAARILVAPTRGRERGEAEHWYGLACTLEDDDPEAARDAYARALSIDPRHGRARVNLGRLLHAQGDLAAAEDQYRSALETNPRDATALFNLGVALEDRGRVEEAVRAYEGAIAADAGLADAHHNLARLLEAAGCREAALVHLLAYRRLGA